MNLAVEAILRYPDFDGRSQFRQITMNDLPNLFGVNTKIVVSYHIPESFDLRPLNHPRSSCPEGIGEFFNHLADIPRLGENAKHLNLEAVNPESLCSRDENRTERLDL